jgi:ketosteroid isomerase-like protein
VADTGRRVVTEEYAFYRLRDGRIAEVWGTADDLALLRQLQSPGLTRRRVLSEGGGRMWP